MKIERIEWLDHYSQLDNWSEIPKGKDDMDLLHIISVGFVVHENKKSVTLALNLETHGKTVSQCITIGKKLIKSRIVIGQYEDPSE